MTEQHLDTVLEIYTHYVLNTTVTFHSKPPSRDEMKDIVFFNSDRYKTFLICDDDEVCGYVLITQHKKREAYDVTAEVTIYLKPDCAGKGLGSMALNHIEEYAKTQNLHVLVSNICFENKASIKLFERNGYWKCGHFKEIGHKFGQRLDMLAYQKILS